MPQNLKQHQQQIGGSVGGSSGGRERLLRVGGVQQLMSQKNNKSQGGVSYLDQETRAPLEDLKQVRLRSDKDKDTEITCFPVHIVTLL